MTYPTDLLICLERNPDNDGHVALGERLEEISTDMGVSINVVWKHPMESVSKVATVEGSELAAKKACRVCRCTLTSLEICQTVILTLSKRAC